MISVARSTLDGCGGRAPAVTRTGRPSRAVSRLFTSRRAHSSCAARLYSRAVT